MGCTETDLEGRIAELVNRLGRVVHCMQFSEGLNPAQWEALRYMRRANRYSRTPTALADFLGTTKGTASQTIKALASKGYLRRLPEPTDGRVCRLEITDAGTGLLQKDPMRRLESACMETGADCSTTIDSLNRLLRGLQSSCGAPEFGTCHRCTHFCGDDAGSESDGPHRCGLTTEPLSEIESTHICVNFQSP